MTAWTRRALRVATLIALIPALDALAQQPVDYTVRVRAPEHHWMEVQVVFREVPAGELQLRMSRSSPGRYALHEFAKNVFQVEATDGAGNALSISRPNPHQWNVTGHSGTVKVTYRIYGDRTDGTYLQIDPTHAHMNGPATFMWARGELTRRPVRVTLVPPGGSDWHAATQLFPTEDPLRFTAPNLRYLMDSPIELGEGHMWEFDTDDGQVVRVAMHHQGSDDEVREYMEGVRAIVAEAKAVYGEYPRFDGGTYTFIADYLPWASGDGMEHRNSTIVSSQASLARAGAGLLGTVSHEFFHAWNVERIRPASLEPFDFEHANMSSELWLAEGFTSYYGGLVLERAGITDLDRLLGSLGRTINAVTTSPGVGFRSAVDMSRLAPFVDAAQSIDRTYGTNTFLSYYTYGAAIALGLDLTLRDRSDGAVTLDTFMRAMWERYGKPGGSEPPEVTRPYDVDGARQVLAQVAGDAGFAQAFFARHITGHEIIDYAPLLARAGLLLRPASAGTAFLGIQFREQQGILYVGAPTQFDTPAYEAGLDLDDAVLSLDGTRLNTTQRLTSMLRQRQPGDTVTLRYRRRDGSEGETQVTLGEAPGLEIVTLESTGGTITDSQRAFRQAWLESQR